MAIVLGSARSAEAQGWLILQASPVSSGKATSYLPVVDLLEAYFKVSERDDHPEMRAKVLGRVAGLDRALEPLMPALLSLLDAPIDPCATAPGRHLPRGRSASRASSRARPGRWGPPSWYWILRDAMR